MERRRKREKESEEKRKEKKRREERGGEKEKKKINETNISSLLGSDQLTYFKLTDSGFDNSCSIPSLVIF